MADSLGWKWSNYERISCWGGGGGWCSRWWGGGGVWIPTVLSDKGFDFERENVVPTADFLCACRLWVIASLMWVSGTNLSKVILPPPSIFPPFSFTIFTLFSSITKSAVPRLLSICLVKDQWRQQLVLLFIMSFINFNLILWIFMIPSVSKWSTTEI